jgi:hypothetical protein
MNFAGHQLSRGPASTAKGLKCSLGSRLSVEWTVVLILLVEPARGLVSTIKQIPAFYNRGGV